PVMEFDGARVPDSSGILDFLDARFPEPPLVARHPWVARQQRPLESWLGESFFFYWVRWLRANVAPRDVDPSKSTELQRMGILGRIGELLASGPSLLGDLGPEFQRRLDDLVGFLGARPFFHADRPSRADLTAAAFLASLEAGTVPGGKHMLAAGPAGVGWLGRGREVTGRGCRPAPLRIGLPRCVGLRHPRRAMESPASPAPAPRPPLRPDDGRLVRGRASRARILAAARELFRERGFDGATLRAIASRCGMGASSLYRHIRSKEELLVEDLAVRQEEAWRRFRSEDDR